MSSSSQFCSLATNTFAFVLVYLLWYSRRRRILLMTNLLEEVGENFISKSIPVASKEFLDNVAKKYGAVSIYGRRVVIISDYDSIKNILNKQEDRFNRRLANQQGLKILGMFNEGVIWNNDEGCWNIIREIFHKSIKSIIPEAIQHAELETRALICELKSLEKVDILNFIRKVTFRTSLKVFFGLRNADIEWSEYDVISSIVNYFKAWEYYLIRPENTYDHASSSHNKSISDLNAYVELILQKCASTVTARDDGLFISRLFSMRDRKKINHSMLRQCALEILLAGTDTSSVTAAYAMLAISDPLKPSLQKKLYLSIKSGIVNDLQKCVNLSCDEKMFKDVCRAAMRSNKDVKNLMLETLRFKPVGPVIIRQAAEYCILPNGLHINPNDGVIIHLERMNRDEDLFANPNKFDPSRFALDSDLDRKFFPFGAGPKGCVGSELGKAEVKSIIATLVMHLEFKAENDMTIENLNTHWDIANQPAEGIILEVSKRPKSIVITGASSTGKTWLASRLKNESALSGFDEIKEIARELMITDEWEGVDVKEIENNIKLQREILRVQVHREQTLGSNERFLGFIADRGMDPFAYLILNGQENAVQDYFLASPDYSTFIHRHQQALVLMLEPREDCLVEDGTRDAVARGGITWQRKFNEVLTDLLTNSFCIPFLTIPSSVSLEDRVAVSLSLHRSMFDI